MTTSASIRVNRAPVLTLWASIVAERLGYPASTTLTLGRAIAGYSAMAKARTRPERLSITHIVGLNR